MQNSKEDMQHIYQSLLAVANTVATSKAYVPFEDEKKRWLQKKAQEVLADMILLLRTKSPIPRHKNNKFENELCALGLMVSKNDWRLGQSPDTEAAIWFADKVKELPRIERNHLVRELSLPPLMPMPRQAASGVVSKNEQQPIYAVVRMIPPAKSSPLLPAVKTTKSANLIL